jgi:hypothetical protein
MPNTDESKTEKLGTTDVKVWTSEADDFLFSNFLGLKDEDLAANLGRSIEVLGKDEIFWV